MEIVVLDFETTGLSCQRHRVIEVGACIVNQKGDVVSTFQELCNPGTKVSKFITKFTGISNEMLVGQPKPEDTMIRLFDFVGSRPIVAHNASFDSQFFRAEMKRAKKNATNTFICTLLLSRRLLQGVSSFKLSHLKSIIDFQAASDHRDHRALDDVFVTVHLWNLLISIVRCNLQSEQVTVDLIVGISKMPKKKADSEFPTRFLTIPHSRNDPNSNVTFESTVDCQSILNDVVMAVKPSCDYISPECKNASLTTVEESSSASVKESLSPDSVVVIEIESVETLHCKRSSKHDCEDSAQPLKRAKSVSVSVPQRAKQQSTLERFFTR